MANALLPFRTCGIVWWFAFGHDDHAVAEAVNALLVAGFGWQL